MVSNEVLVSGEDLKAFTAEVFIGAGLAPEDAEIEADVLVWANLRGVDSHGVLRIPWYMSHVDNGVMKTRPNIQVMKETAATILIDADQAFGPVVTTMAMRRAIEKAKNTGIGWGFIRNTTHQGAMGYYALMAAKEDMAGIACVAGPPNMAPHGARAAGVQNSPIAISVPGNRRGPLVLDMATSIAAGGKIWLAIDKRVPIPANWALDKDGNPTTDPKLAEILMPFSGPKGSGLAIMFECLAGLMVGNPRLEPVITGKQEINRHIQNSFVAALDIETFTDVDGYKDEVDKLVDGLKALPKAEGAQEIFMPGEPEDRVFQDRTRNGIPLPEGTVDSLKAAAERFDIPLPAGL